MVRQSGGKNNIMQSAHGPLVWRQEQHCATSLSGDKNK